MQIKYGWILLSVLLLAACGGKGALSGAPGSSFPAPDCPIHPAGNEPELVTLDTCGRLYYYPYANRGQAQARNRLPDFSHAGYQGGGVALPEVPVVAVLNPTPGEGDDLARIQAALDALGELPVNAQGHRGALLLTRGTYYLSDTLRIRHNGVVLRGEGQGKDGTVLIATRQAPHALIELHPEGRRQGLIAAEGSYTNITSGYVGVGERRFEVEDTRGYAVGDVIGVQRTPNNAWIEQLGMAQWGWTTDYYTLTQERVITAIEDRWITVDIPLVDTLETAFGGGLIFRADPAALARRLQEVGVENLRLVARHTDPAAEQHANIGIRLVHTQNAWVHGVSGVHFSYATVSIEQQSNFNTVQEVAYLEPASQVRGGRRYAFNISSGLGNLFQRCYSESGRHSFVTGSRVTGPNVWLDCVSVRASNDEGPHHRWSTGLLFDNIKARFINVQNRKSSGTGHGWAGAQVMIWNAEAAEGFIVDAPYGAMNWIVGSVGRQNEGNWAPEEPPGWWQSHGSPVEPRSLYLQQLQDRLGASAVAAITLPEQREGRIWEWLQGWAGEGSLNSALPLSHVPGECSGFISGQACCPSECGRCGGSGCHQLPGGSDQCCVSNVLKQERSCAQYEAPCVVP